MSYLEKDGVASKRAMSMNAKGGGEPFVVASLEEVNSLQSPPRGILRNKNSTITHNKAPTAPTSPAIGPRGEEVYVHHDTYTKNLKSDKKLKFGPSTPRSDGHDTEETSSLEEGGEDGVDFFIEPPPDEELAELVLTLRYKMCEAAHMLDFTDDELKVFLRNRNYHLKPTLSLIKTYSQWYERYDLTPTSLVVDRVENTLLQGIIMAPVGMRTKKGHRVMYMRPARYFPKTMDLQKLMEAATYIYERMVEDPEVQEKGFTFMADMSEWNWNNFSIRYATAWFKMMQFRFPVKLASWLMVDTPPWFNRVWLLIRPGMTAKFASKWEFYTRETIEEAIEPSNLPLEMGGHLDCDMEHYVEYRRQVEDGEIGYGIKEQETMRFESFVNKRSATTGSSSGRYNLKE